MNRRVLFAFASLALFIVALGMALQKGKAHTIPPITTSPGQSSLSSVTPAEAYARATYKNTLIGYTVAIPMSWQIEELPAAAAYTSRVVFTPKQASGISGTANYVSITVIDHAPSTQKLSTKQEFETWYAKSTNSTEGTIVKMANTMVDDNPTVLLTDTTVKTGWSKIAWFQYGSENFYIMIKGTGALAPADEAVFSYLLSTVNLYK
jgi:hypothetical protein